MAQKSKPVIVDLEPEELPAPEAAPAIEDGPMVPTTSVQAAAQMLGGKRSGVARFALSALLALVSFWASVAAWNFVTGLLERSPILGTIAFALIAAFVLSLLILAMREVLALFRLGRVDRLQSRAAAALAGADLPLAKKVSTDLRRLYRGRDVLAEPIRQQVKVEAEVLDADGILAAAETGLLTQLDRDATQRIEAASRQVATMTALVPLALADVVTALTANLRMIRQIAEIYGGRSGTLGNWRLTRSVLSHLVATGAVAIGDDMIGSVAGGGILSKVSRRFGEGLINGALTARVGIAAMEVCRPLPFVANPKPKVTAVLQRSMTGLFTNAK